MPGCARAGVRHRPPARPPEWHVRRRPAAAGRSRCLPPPPPLRFAQAAAGPRGCGGGRRYCTRGACEMWEFDHGSSPFFFLSTEPPHAIHVRYLQRPIVAPICVSGHYEPQPRLSYATAWNAYDMWMFWGSRTWSRRGVVHRVHVLLVCRKFWCSQRSRSLILPTCVGADPGLDLLGHYEENITAEPSANETCQPQVLDFIIQQEQQLRVSFFKFLSTWVAQCKRTLQVSPPQIFRLHGLCTDTPIRCVERNQSNDCLTRKAGDPKSPWSTPGLAGRLKKSSCRTKLPARLP
jgi:hypothetical protein